MQECSVSGYEIETCGAAEQYCPECEGKYCLSYNDTIDADYYNLENGLRLSISTYDYDYDCKYPQKRIIVFNFKLTTCLRYYILLC